ncbi:MAG: FHA domain-containing protein [Deltaproteobacteria bacterium]|nr:FHA domain-containing protein [Deltaproteobacteria bacterium]MCB9785265.1 FHA domain-containing protein [Deltaproteobacteria bacterium]
MPQLMVKLKERELQVVPITKPVFTIGRDPNNDVIIDNVGVSRIHASLTLEGSELIVRDMASANGVYVNGRQVDAHPFRDGDQIQIGKFVVEYLEQGGPTLEDISGEGDLVGRPRPTGLSPVETTHMKPEELRAALQSGGLIAPESELVGPPEAFGGAVALAANDDREFLRKAVVGLAVATMSLAGVVLWLTFAS